MEEKIVRLKKWMEGGKAPPITIELNVTNRCNQKCLSCWQRAGNIDYGEMHREKWIEIVREAGRMGVKEIRIPGSGEPLIKKDLVLKIMEEAKKYNMSGILITNGTLFDSDAIRKIVEIGWDNVTFSIDGPDADTNDYLRGMTGAFDRATKWLEKFYRIKEQSGKDKPLLRLNVVLSNKNYNKLDKIMNLANRLKCNSVSVQPMTVFSQFGENLKLGKEEMAELPRYIRIAKALADKYGIHTNVGNFIDSETIEKTNEMDKVMQTETSGIENRFLSLPCFEPWYNIIISPGGVVGPCSMFGGVNGIDVKDKSLEDVWYGKYFTNIRKRLLKKDLFDFCKNCCVVVFEETKRLRSELSKLNGV